MSSPLGHTLMGFAAGTIVARALLVNLPGTAKWPVLSWRWLVLVVVSANAADLDFLPGLLIGDMNRWHHAGSHSLLAACLWGILIWLGITIIGSRNVERQSTQRHSQAVGFALCAVAIYASHLLLDWLTQDTRAPIGIPLLWPLDGFSLSSWTPLGGVRHGVPGDSFLTVMREIFSWHNVQTALWELVVCLPAYLVLLGWFVVSRQDVSRTQDRSNNT